MIKLVLLGIIAFLNLWLSFVLNLWPSFVFADTLLPSLVPISSLDLSKATQGYGQPQADHSVDGHSLTLKGRVFPRGFGTHAPSLLAIDLDETAQRFQAIVGINDEVGAGLGHAEFQVWADGKCLWRSHVRHCGDTSQTIYVSVVGIKQLVLRVTTAGFGSATGNARSLDRTGHRPASSCFYHPRSAAGVRADTRTGIPSGKCSVRNLWQRKSLGLREGRITLTVPAHGAVLLELKRS